MAIIKNLEKYGHETGKLKANVGDWIDNCEFEFTQSAVVYSDVGNICKHTTPISGVDQFSFSSFDWTAKGWSVGDVLNCSVNIETYSETFANGVWTQGVHTQDTLTFNITISSIQGSVITLTSPPSNLLPTTYPFETTALSATLMPGTSRHTNETSTTRDTYHYGNIVINNTSRPEVVDFSFNLSRESNVTPLSVIDGEENRFRLSGMNALPMNVDTPMTELVNRSGGLLQGVTIRKVSENADFSTKYAVKFDINQWGYIEDGFQEPSYYDLTGQLVPVVKITTTTINGGIDEEIITTSSIDDTGGFDEIFNGGFNPFVVDSIEWRDDLNNVISSVSHVGESTFKAIIDTGGNQFENHRYRIGLIYRPEDSSIYQNKVNNLGKNLLLNAPRDYYAPSTSPSSTMHNGMENSGGSRWDLTDLLFKTNGNKLEVSGKVIPNTSLIKEFEGYPDGNRRVTIWVSLGSTPYFNGTSYEVSRVDRVSLKLEDNDSIEPPKKGSQIRDIIEEVLLDHGGNDITNGATVKNTTTEDDVLYKSSFLLPDNVTYNGFKSSISAFNQSTGEEFELESNYISFGSVIIQNGQYQPNIMQQRALNLSPSSDRNHYSLKRKQSLDVAGKYGIEFQYGFVNNWRYWLSQSNVNPYFYSPSPNNSPIPPHLDQVNDNDGLNKNWEKFQTGGWKIRISYFLDVSGTLDYNHLNYGIRPYEDDVDVTTTVTLKNLQNGNIVLTPLANTIHELKVDFNWNNNFDDEWVKFTIEDKEGASLGVMSSIHPLGNAVNSPLKPIVTNGSIDVTGNGTNTLTCKALLDTTVINYNDVSMSYRVFSTPNETGGNPLIMRVESKLDGSDFDDFTLTFSDQGDCDVLIMWGDGSSDTFSAPTGGSITHSYTTDGINKVEIFGNFAGLYFFNSSSAPKVVYLDQWGGNAWVSMDKAFFGCKKMVANYIDTPNVSAVENYHSALRDCEMFNGEINSWDMTNAKVLFAFALNSTVFNPDLSNHTFPNVTTLQSAFYGTLLDRNLGHFELANCGSLETFVLSPLSTANYDNTLTGWLGWVNGAPTKTMQSGIVIGMGSSKYTIGSDADDARSYMINTLNITLTDGGGV